MYSFFISLFFYLILTVATLKCYHGGVGIIRSGVKETLIDATFDVINFVNSIIATIMSSTALYELGPDKRYAITKGKTISLEKWTIESVCAYICVEFMFLFISSFTVTMNEWASIKSRYFNMECLHLVGLIGLSTVLVFDCGYPLAMWVIWTELTSVFLGIQSITRTKNKLLDTVTNIVYFLQRVVLLLYLVWLSFVDIKWEVHYIAQFSLLVAGLVFNIIMLVKH